MTKLDNYRENIDKIDKELIILLSKRLNIVKKVGEYKKDNNMPALQNNRWNEVLESKKKLGEEFGLKADFVEVIWNNIHDEALKIEDKILLK